MPITHATRHAPPAQASRRRRRTWHARFSAPAALLTLVATSWSTAHAATVSGTVKTVTRSGVPPATAVVYAEPLTGSSPRQPATSQMRQKNKQFQPRVIAVPQGSTVAFPNEDPIFHNVFSLSPPKPFDLGLYRAGATRTRTFNEPGVYRVYCNIHPRMSALIVVAPSPWMTVATGDGRFRLDLPPGRYRLTALSERAGPATQDIEVGTAAADGVVLTLDESNWVPAPHKNKYGQDYPREAYTDR